MCPAAFSHIHMSNSIATEHFCSKDDAIRYGRFYRRSEARWIQRFKCRECGRHFSYATGTLEFRQKKRRVNLPLFKLLCSGVSMRRCALLLQIDRRTVDRKLVYLAKKSRLHHLEFLKRMKGKVQSFEFDDLITSEHTKMKPLTVSLAVDADRRYILGAKVGRVPAFGLIAEKSRKKYGRRQNEHSHTLTELFKEVADTVSSKALVQSDEHQRYPEFVKRYLPGREHRCYPGGRAAIVGQGELKKKAFDPIFILNHSCAMLRGGVNRLIRKTWCTTKRPDRLQMHLDIFLDFYNRIYLPERS